MKVQIDLPPVTIANALCSAVEHGIGYWCKDVVPFVIPDGMTLKKHFKFDRKKKCWDNKFNMPYYAALPLLGGAIRCYRPDEPFLLVIDQNSIERGLKAMSATYPEHFERLVKEEGGDATIGDVFFQCCLFGRIIYGQTRFENHKGE